MKADAPTTPRPQRRALARWLLATTAAALLLTTLAAGVQAQIGLACAVVSGNIDPNAIKIDGTLTGAPFDWVKDALPNTDAASYCNSVAIGIIPGVTGASTGATGHWNGVRIVDPSGKGDDIFLTGSKENDDPRTWNIGIGTTGAGKYDITQCYLANNQTTLFFGAERSTTTGTTEYEIEFNKLAPIQNNFTPGALVPNRSANDILVAFLFQGQSPPAVFVAKFVVGTGYVLTQDPNVLSAINTANLPSEPWGNEQKGSWSLSDLPAFSFGEVAVPLADLGVTSACGQTFYAMVRSRSSTADTSALQDTTKIFPYSFGGPTASMALGSLCNGSFTFAGTGSKNAQGGQTGLTYNWVFAFPAGSALTGQSIALTAIDATHVGYTSLSATPQTILVTPPAGAAYADIQATLTVTVSGCSDTTVPHTVRVFVPLSASASLSAPCSSNHSISYSSSVSGGNGPYTYAWQLLDASNNVVATSTTASGSFTPASAGTYHAALNVTDTADTSADPFVTPKPVCPASAPSNAVTAYDQLTATASMSAPCSDTRQVNYTSTPSGGNAPYTYAWVFSQGGVQIGTSTTQSGSFNAPAAGAVSATLTISDTADAASGKGVCQVSPPVASVNAYDALTAKATLSAGCDSLAITFSSTVTGGNAPYSYAWTFFDAANNQVGTATGPGGTFTPTVDGTYHAHLVVSDTADAASGKGVCAAPADSNAIDAKAPMNPTAAKGAVSADGTSVTLNGTAHAPDSIQWQVADTETATNPKDPSTATFADITGGTTLSIVYGAFQTDDKDPQPVVFSLNGVPYNGLVYTVYVRMKTTRTLNGQVCVDYSNILTISQIVATDPAGHGHRNIK